MEIVIDGYKVGVVYSRYGYIKVSAKEAEQEGGPIPAAEKKLREMSAADLDAVTEYLEDSEEIDEEAVIPIPKL